ncbi:MULTISPECIES: ScbR family autoregulator-binding transcription factor [Streptomyces]|uniref:ScbR family autoregulator-binding transcription factor n=1 Tax=Streptomyces TaxID=1883 RepID=UPI00039D8E21|nr:MULTISPECIES: ScbR family autoregulator-binding transcription factor [Streptomyces]MBY8865757.1 TetR/AcrR family transcriptional regulator [Streptomyces sennicomposti]MYX28442.1 TetR family transcriptional regulator [Streptomyces sp. SID8381]NMO36342.1 TetR/AcrR family transcriptional regulator [Streptomyces sp. GMY02]
MTTTGKRSEPKQERARRTRAQILRVAAELFAERGYATVTLQDVAERASMTKGAVYFHYKNKEELAVAVVQEHYARWPAILEEVTVRRLPPYETLVTVLDRVTRAFRDDIVVQAGARLQVERSLINGDLPKPYVGWEDYLTGLVEAIDEAGELRPGITPRGAARVLVAAFFGMQHISDVLARRADLTERYGELRHVVLEGLRA